MTEKLTLKRVSTIIAGQSPTSTLVEPLGEGIPFLQGNAEFGASRPHPVWECADPPKRATRGDVLVSVRAPVGAVMVADRDYGIGRGLNAVRAARIEPTYLQWLLTNSSSYLNSVATGSTYAAITSSDLASVVVPVTALDEQHEIADYLDREISKIDELIAKQEQLVSTLGERRDSMIDEMVAAQTRAEGLSFRVKNLYRVCRRARWVRRSPAALSVNPSRRPTSGGCDKG